MNYFTSAIVTIQITQQRAKNIYRMVLVQDVELAKHAEEGTALI